jgi:hypothetical protein
VHQLDGDVVVDPLGAVQGGGCRSGDGCLAVRPQPFRSDALLKRWLGLLQ